VKAELEIELLHEKIDLLKDKELLLLTQAVKDLSAQLAELRGLAPATVPSTSPPGTPAASAT
jgi:hypothetical protein